ncbi:DUF742 domain-containing protein [Nocardioides endophyticus]|uniref:DUF742 domain-containing protein n=1 Tax=Nocardioides endophyticus TaxID=1353775 RepID=A0ABP8YJP9_9ACTN
MAADTSPDDDVPSGAPAVRVRAFTLTSGRTTPRVDLPVEATLRRLGAATAGPVESHLTRILEVCDRRSVAEVSALVAMPIGVVRVLLADLVELGQVRVQTTIQEDSSFAERRELIERTLRGLRTL